MNEEKKIFWNGKKTDEIEEQKQKAKKLNWLKEQKIIKWWKKMKREYYEKYGKFILA